MILPARRSLTAAVIAAALAAVSAAAWAQNAGPSGLKVPRFVSLRSEPVNMRTGPADTHPVAWVYHKRDLPVEITAEHKNWRRIRDWEGAEGWVHQSLLSGRRTVLVVGQQRALRSSASEQAGAVAMLEPGVVARVSKCPRDTPFCRVETGGHDGWVRRDEVWGVYPSEEVD